MITNLRMDLFEALVTLLVQVIQRRGQLAGGNINFTRGWADYKAGFGALGGEFWAGNDAIR